MRVRFIQHVIDRLRGKGLHHPIPVTATDVHHGHLDRLFEDFQSATFEINGKSRPYLSNVNADRGVTEQTLSLLCEAFPGDRRAVKVLNVGCGKKDQMAFLTALGFDACGIDFDIDRDTDRIKFHDLNQPTDIPFDAGGFDAVVCQEIIEHIENPWLVFRKIKRVLKVGGTLIVTTPNISSNASKRIFTGNSYGFFAYFDPANLWQHINAIPYWEMTHIATFNGFQPVVLSGCNEYYVKFKARKGDAEAQAREVTLQYNEILHYVLKNLDAEIKPYSPVPTYNYDWTAGRRA